MKLRILFVDDEPHILAAMRRQLRPMRNEWDTDFANSGEEALAKLAESPFDVIVTDMRMPGMSGAELLAEAKRRFPRTIRVVLSGHSDIELVLSSVGPSHQYLSKPCDPDILRATIQSAGALRDLLEDESLRTVVGRMDHLPSVPQLFTELLQQLQTDEPSLKEIGEIVSRDVGMTAQVLRLVNSAYFGLRQEITSAQRAVNYLGIGPLSSLILSQEVFREADAGLLARMGLSKIWQRSTDVATVAKRIAAAQTAEVQVLEDSFTAGLLHDVGRVVLAMNYSEQYEKLIHALPGEDRSLCELEREEFGSDHGAVGGYLMSAWGLPSSVIEALVYHHEPSRCATPNFAPLTAVHAALVLLDEASGARHATARDEAYLERLGASGKLEEWGEACGIAAPATQGA